MDEVRTIRDEMDERITKLVAELLAPCAREIMQPLARPGSRVSTGTSTTVARRDRARALLTTSTAKKAATPAEDEAPERVFEGAPS